MSKNISNFPIPRVSSDPTIAKQKILVVEDHADTRFMLRVILELENFIVMEAVDGDEGYNCAVRECPDLILMDLNLPQVDGLCVTQRIRQDTVIGKTPIIFLTGRAEQDQRKAAYAAGCNGFLVKPLNLDEVLNVIGRCLNVPIVHH
jgi:CheY-like chemotaxis protein